MQLVDLTPFRHSVLDAATEDGVLHIGPIHRTDAQSIVDLLSNLGLTTGADDAIRLTAQGKDMVSMAVTGMDVTGYLMEDFGIEAETEALDAFILRACPAGTPISLRGHYHPDDETRITSVMTALHDGRRVTWTSFRLRMRDGETLRLSDTPGTFPMVQGYAAAASALPAERAFA